MIQHTNQKLINILKYGFTLDNIRYYDSPQGDRYVGATWHHIDGNDEYCYYLRFGGIGRFYEGKSASETLFTPILYTGESIVPDLLTSAILFQTGTYKNKPASTKKLNEIYKSKFNERSAIEMIYAELGFKIPADFFEDE